MFIIFIYVNGIILSTKIYFQNESQYEAQI